MAKIQRNKHKVQLLSTNVAKPSHVEPQNNVFVAASEATATYASTAEQHADQPHDISNTIYKKWVTKLLVLAPVLIPMVIFLVTGLRGIDFGYYWDDNYHLKEISGSVQKLILLPDGLYDYPSICYWLELLGIIPTIIHSIQLLGTDTALIQQRTLEVIQSPEYLLRMRSIFLFISSLSLVWVYILVGVWQKNWIEAFIASCVLAGSWEVAYQARWLAPDALMMQFGALTMLCVMMTHFRKESRFWLRTAAVFAGICCGTKYPGGLFLIPIFVATYFMLNDHYDNKKFTLISLEICAIFTVTYLVTTPGTILQYSAFYEGAYLHTMVWYGDAHFGYTVTPGPDHLWKLITYLSIALLSPYSYIALSLFLLALFGLHTMYKKSPHLAINFMCFPIIYILYFCMQRVMVVRNLLVVVPFFSILAAHGIVVLWSYIPLRIIRLAFISLVVFFLTINMYWSIWTSQTIIDRKSNRYIGELAEYIDERKTVTFFVSERIDTELKNYDKKQRANVTTKIIPWVHTIVFRATEGFTDITTANDFSLTTTWFGSWEANYNYYPSWVANDPIIVMPRQKAIDSHVSIFQQQ